MKNFEKAIYMLRCLGFLTVSRACGWYSDTSDYDYCFSIEHFDFVKTKMKNLVDDDKIFLSDYNNGVKYILDNKTINIIPVHPQNLQSWHHATTALKAMYPTLQGLGKKELHGFFEAIVGISKSLCCYHVQPGDVYNIGFSEIKCCNNVYDHIDSMLDVG